MTKAILKNDVIVHITENKNAIEIGRPPKNIGLERLRFDGTNIIDLADLSEMWVRQVSPGYYSLHVVQLPDTQLVSMAYTDRKNLTIDAGVIRVKNQLEIDNERLVNENSMLKNRLRKRIDTKIGDLPDQLADLNKIVAVLVAYVLTDNARAKTMLDNLLPILKDMYNPDDIEDILMTRFADLKSELINYRQEKL